MKLKVLSDRSFKDYHTLVCVFLYFLTIAALYHPTLQFEYNIDDSYYLKLLPDKDMPLKDQLMQAGQLFNRSELRPVTLASFILESYFFGQSPRVHHLFNLVYYLLLAISIHFLIKRLSAGEKSASAIIFLTTLFFIVHPSHVNVVASIKNREGIISLLFACLAIQVWVWTIRRQKWWGLPAVILLLVTGIFAKRDVLSFVLILPVTGYLFVQEKSRTRLIYFFTSVVLIAGTAITVASIFNINPPDPEKMSFVSFAENPAMDFRGVRNYIIGLQSLWLYERFMILPGSYYFYFGYDTIALWTPKSVGPYVVLAIHLIILFFIIRQVKHRRTAVIGLCIFFIALLPFLNLFMKAAGIVAVRYAFPASLGFCMTLSWYGVIMFERSLYTKLTGIVLGVFILSSSVYFTVKRVPDWKSKESLFEADLPDLRNSVVANRMAAAYYFSKFEELRGSDKGREYLLEAFKYNNRAMNIYDEDPDVLTNQAKILGMLDHHAEVQSTLRTLVKVAPERINGWSLLGSHSRYMRYFDEAIFAYERILDIDSTQVMPYAELTLLYAERGEFERLDSLNSRLASLALPDYPQLVNLGNAALIRKDTLEAVLLFVEQMEKSGQVDPREIEKLTEYATAKEHREILDRLENLQRKHTK